MSAVRHVVPFAEPHHCPKCEARSPWAEFVVEWFPSDDSEYGRLRVMCGRCRYRWWKQTADTPLTPPMLTPEQEAAAEVERLLGNL